MLFHFILQRSPTRRGSSGRRGTQMSETRRYLTTNSDETLPHETFHPRHRKLTISTSIVKQVKNVPCSKNISVAKNKQIIELGRKNPTRQALISFITSHFSVSTVTITKSTHPPTGRHIRFFPRFS